MLGATAASLHIMGRRPLPRKRLCLFLGLPMIVEIGLGVLGVAQSNNWVRAATGGLFGFFFLMGALQYLAGRGESQSLSGDFSTLLTILTWVPRRGGNR